MSDEQKVQEETKPFNWLWVVIPVGVAVVLFLMFATSLNSKMVEIVAGTIALVVVLVGVKLSGWFDNVDAETVKWATAIIGISTLIGAAMWFSERVVEFMTFDQTLISPLLFLLVCLGIGVAIPYWVINIKIEDPDEKGFHFKENRIVYASWLNFMLLIYGFSSYHFRVWWPSVIASVVTAISIWLLYESIKRWEREKVYSIKGKRHEMLTVLSCVGKKTWIVFMLTFVVTILLPVALIIYFGVDSWWHITVVASAYVSGLWQWYLVWYRQNLADISMTYFVELPKTSAVEVRKRYDDRQKKWRKSFLFRLLVVFGLKKP